MIRYDLQCSQAHEFDGWFKDSEAFAKLAKAGLVECPACGATEVSKRLMTPAVRKAPGVKGRPDRLPTPAPARAAPPPPEPPQAPPAPPPGQAVAGPVPAQVVAMLQRMRAEVEKHCDYVGKDFAEEARRIHRGESERPGIYGETTESEAEALRDEGIEVARIPWVPRADG
ncbi:MAG: DUF1178 family protein [Acetobacteraceae bacterium]|nr:DUF1178 family protein [Acetobacteraceae bacterium]